jgi:phenylacetate-CoA ligase
MSLRDYVADAARSCYSKHETISGRSTPMNFRFRDYLVSPFKLVSLHRWMKETPAWSRERMDGWILGRLRELTTRAAERIPYYQRAFGELGFRPDRLDSFDDWRKLPLLDKDAVRSHFDDLKSNDAHSLGAVPCTTSGSTGTAMTFLLDRDVNMAAFALFWRVWSMCPSWHIGKRQVSLSGYSGGKWEYQWKARVLALSSFHLSRESVGEFAGLIKSYGPKFLRGYPSSLYLFARLLDEAKLSVKFPFVFSGAETLLPFQRARIEQTFGCRLIDHYSHWERCGSICECMYGRLHAENDYGFHEIIDAGGQPAKPGEIGKLVATSLHNRAMPLFRYDTRDLAVWSAETECPCGSRFPIIERIVGRIEDVVLTPEGRLVGRLDAALKYSPHIRLAQLIQESTDLLRVLLVCDAEYNELDDEGPLLRELRARLGEAIEIRIEKVADIPRTPGGKLRFVVSKVDPGMKLEHH